MGLTLVALWLAARHGFHSMLRWCRLCSSGAGVTGLRLVRRQILHAETPQSLRQDALALGKVRGAGDSSTLAEIIISKAPYYTHFQIFIFLSGLQWLFFCIVLNWPTWLNKGEIIINKAALCKWWIKKIIISGKQHFNPLFTVWIKNTLANNLAFC